MQRGAKFLYIPPGDGLRSELNLQYPVNGLCKGQIDSRIQMSEAHSRAMIHLPLADK